MKSLRTYDSISKELAALRRDNAALRARASNAKMAQGLKEMRCPVCMKLIVADESYVAPYQHLLVHLLPGEDDLRAAARATRRREAASNGAGAKTDAHL